MVLRESEEGATSGKSFATNVTGQKNKKSKGKTASIGATVFIVLLFVVAAVLFGMGNLMPTAIMQRLIEETDVQYADLVESKKIVLQQAMRDGKIPSDTAEKLKENGYTVGYVNKKGEFVEDNSKSGKVLALKHDDRIITADEFIEAMDTDAQLYAAVRAATYDRAAAYYDDAAYDVFADLGTNRNNFTEDSDFEKVMHDKMGSGSAIEINSAEMAENTVGEGEEQQTVQEPQTTGMGAYSAGGAAAFIEEVRQKNPAASADESAVKAADTLKVADAVAQEQRSSLFFALFMENISKMKAGDGNESKINDAMNFLTTEQESKVVDVKTGEVTKVSGTPLEAPSLYALLADEKANKEEVDNYSEERVLKTIRNKATAAAGYAPASGTVASVEDRVRGSIGTMVNSRAATASAEVMQSVEPTIESSLVKNGYETIKGIKAGEFLAEGAISLGRKLAQTSGATAGDAEAVAQYARVNQGVLAMEAKADRETLSPLDIRSKNTFLGSIVYNLAMAQVKYPEVRSLATLGRRFGSVLGTAVASLIPVSLADGNDNGFMTDYGECETAGGVGAVATAGCAQIAVFDPSTLNDPFHDAGFVAFLDQNTELESGVRKVKPGSTLADFITFSMGRETPIGVMDGGILDALEGGTTQIPFISDILAMVRKLLGASERDKRMASGAAYVNTASNADWQQIKYAQRYAALARATAMLKQHSSDATAYRDMKYFEGEENPVIAYLREYKGIARK